jgi:hypothetical protein
MDGSVRIVGSGVDTLVLNIYPTDSEGVIVQRRVDEALQEELRLLKERAQAAEEDVVTRFVFDGGNLLMRAKGSEGFNWILYNQSLTLAVNRGSKMALLGQVRLSSQYLWSVGHLDRAISDVHLFLSTVFGDDIMLQVSSIDLAVDVVGLELGSVAEVKEHFITRAQLDEQKPLAAGDDGMLDGPDAIKRRWRRMTGLSFGARNGQVSALLYDKTHEIKYHSPGKVWFHDLWLSVKDEEGKPLWDGTSSVWRIEIRFKRRALHEFKQETAKGEVLFWGIENAYDLMERLPLLWSYAVGHVGGGVDGLPDGWLRYVVPTEDSNRSRWPVHPDWQVIQTAFQPAFQSEAQKEDERQEDASAPAQAGEASRSAPVGMVPSVPLRLVPVMRKRHYQVNMRQMVAQVAGCVLTTEAWRPYEDGKIPDEVEDADLSVTFHFLFERVLDYLQEKQQRKPNWSCAKTIERKRVVYQLEQAAVA